MPATPTFRTTTRHMLKESKTYASQTLMGSLSGLNPQSDSTDVTAFPP